VVISLHRFADDLLGEALDGFQQHIEILELAAMIRNCTA
jgi:hypothetical protein